MRQLLSILICLALALSLFPCQSFANDYELYDSVFFGRYEQELDPSYEGPEAIEWTLVDKSEDGSKGLLVAYCVLDSQLYSTNTSVNSWERSSIRKWLNTSFYNEAFTDEEKAVILTTDVKNDRTQNVTDWKTSGGRDTQDKVFLLSSVEYYSYFGEKDEFPFTDYAKQIGKTKKDTGPFWLRNPGKKDGQACTAVKGLADSQAVDKPAGVCPAIWVDLSANWDNLPHAHWEKAIELYDRENYQVAFPVFDELGNYNYSSFYAGLCLFGSAIDSVDDEERIQIIKELQIYCEDKSLKDPDYPDYPLFLLDSLDILCDSYYKAAKTAQDNQDYERAIGYYKETGNYEDSIQRLLQCYDAAGINYAFIDVDPVNAGNNGGYAANNKPASDDPHSGWKLGRFIISGFTEETDTGVFLKTLGDDITLMFELYEDINCLNGNEKLSIANDSKAIDVPFNYNEKNTAFGAGALLVQHEDFRHNKSPIHPYEDFLFANYSGLVNTSVEINEEGKYNIALDYLIKDNGFLGKTNGYRISFSFEVKNGDGIAFLRNADTLSELQNYSISENGFKVDLAKSHSVKVHVTRKDISISGTALDVREDKPASDGESFTKPGYYIVDMTNTETGKTVTKNLFVGSLTDLREFIQIEPELGQFAK